MGRFAMKCCSSRQERRWVYLMLLVLIVPATGQGGDVNAPWAGHSELRWSQLDTGVADREKTTVYAEHTAAHCGDDDHFSALSGDRQGAMTVVGHADCDNSNHPCQCLSGACASPLAPVASVSMPLLAPVVTHLSDSTSLPTVRRTGARYRPPIQI